MQDQRHTQLLAYGAAVLATGLSLGIRLALVPWLGYPVELMTFFPVMIISAYLGGMGPGLLATVLGAAVGDYFFIEPRYSFAIANSGSVYAMGMFLLAGAVISVLMESLTRSRRRIAASERRYAVTLASIGDAIIATDRKARVTFLNPVAEAMTGWPTADAVGRPLEEIFQIVNEATREPVEDPAAKVLRLGAVVGLANHTSLIARDGREVPIDDCGAPIVDDGGVITGVVVVFRDVTQRRRAEEAEAFRRANERLELALRGSSVGVFDIEMRDGDLRRGERHYVNLWEQLGYEGRPAGGTALDVAHPDDRVRAEEAALRYLAGESTEYEIETRLRHKDGSYRTMLGRGIAVRDASGKPMRFTGVTVDITGLKHAKEELRRMTQLLQAVVDGTQDAVYVKDRDGRHLMFNSAATRMVGKPAGEVLGRDDTAIFDAADARLVMAHDQRVMASGIADTDEKELTAGGMTRTYLASKSPYRDGQGNIIGIIGICHDITERKRTEDALRASEERWRSLTEALPQLVWRATPDGANEYFSTQWTYYTGLAESETVGWGWMQALHPDDREPTRQLWLESVAGHQPYDVEYRVRRRDGEYRWFKTRGVPIRDSNGAIIKWFGTCTDITDLRQTQEALRQAKARLDLAVRGSNIAIWECNMPDGRIENSHLTHTNVWESMGYDAATPPTDFPSTSAILFHPIDRERVMREIQELFDSDRQDYESEFRVRWQDGSTRWHLSRGTVLRDPGGKPVRFIGTSADITALKQAEEALRERERQLDSLMGHLPGLAYRALADDHWTALFASKGVENLTGYPADEFTSRRLNYADIMFAPGPAGDPRGRLHGPAGAEDVRGRASHSA